MLEKQAYCRVLQGLSMKKSTLQVRLNRRMTVFSMFTDVFLKSVKKFLDKEVTITPFSLPNPTLF